MSYERPEPEGTMLEIVRTLRDNPERYAAVRRALRDAESDEERVQTLVNFATNERDLAALIPARAAGQEEAMLALTITVTTIFVDSAY